MITYIIAFIFYTLAMVGILLIGFIVFKKFSTFQKADKKGLIRVLDSISVAPKKNLLVVKVKNEKFLIALDAERTTFLSKLNFDERPQKVLQQAPQENIQQQEQKFSDIQQRFMELYSKDEEEQKPAQLTKKDMIHKLLKDLNSTNIKTGSY